MPSLDLYAKCLFAPPQSLALPETTRDSVEIWEDNAVRYAKATQLFDDAALVVLRYIPTIELLDVEACVSKALSSIRIEGHPGLGVNCESAVLSPNPRRIV